MAFTKITASGIGSTETVTLDGLSVINDGSFGGNVSVGGTLTYEDVTNIDSVGLITARAGVVVGSGITLSKDGDGFFTGVVTATSYAGDGSALTGISVDSTQIVTGNTSVQTVDTGSDGHVKVNTEGSERLRIDSSGKMGLGVTPTGIFDIREDNNPQLTLRSTSHADDGGGRLNFAIGVAAAPIDGNTICSIASTIHSTSGGTLKGDMKFYTNSGDNLDERLRIDADGKIGIGTDDPSQPVHISRGSAVTRIQSTDASTSARLEIIGANDSYSGLHLGDVDDVDIGAIRYYHAGSSPNHMAFRTGGSERLRIGSAGQLGIGGANYGTSGQVLRSQGSSSAVEWATPSGWVFGTAADYDQWGSVTDVEFSGWPTNWKQIRINFVDISSNANAYIQYFVSKSSSTAARITSGYQTQSGHFGASTSVDSVTNMGRFSGTASSSYSLTGYVNFHKFNGAIIRYEGQCSEDGNSYIYVTNGHVDCDPTDDMSHIFFRCQGYSYDSGKFSMDYLA